MIKNSKLVLFAVIWCWSCGSDPELGVGSGAGSGKGGSGGRSGGASGSGANASLPGIELEKPDAEAEPPLSSESACATDSREAKPAPLDMAMAIDTSYSMDFDNKWPQVSNAILTFADDPRYSELGVALQFFPIRTQCNIEQYAAPAVPMAALLKAAPMIREAVLEQRMAGGTPLVQILQGMGSYMAVLAKQEPLRKRALVLATDGIPDATCSAGSQDPPNTLENAAVIAGELAAADLPVFVIGVGSELKALDTIAKAGGTDAAIIISTSGNVQQQFLAALDQVRRQSLSCEYGIPQPKMGSIDYENVNVQFSDANSKTETFLYAASEGACADAPGGAWYYDDAEAPEKIVLCAQTCDTVKNTPQGTLSALFGCERDDVK